MGFSFLFVSNVISLWLQKIFFRIAVRKQFFIFVLWLTWFVKEKVLCVLEKNVFSGGVGYSVLYVSVRLHCSVGISSVLFPYVSCVWLLCP